MTDTQTDESIYAEFYTDDEGEVRWRQVYAGNGNILSDSGQGYADQRDAIHGFELSTNRLVVHTEVDGSVRHTASLSRMAPSTIEVRGLAE